MKVFFKNSEAHIVEIYSKYYLLFQKLSKLNKTKENKYIKKCSLPKVKEQSKQPFRFI